METYKAAMLGGMGGNAAGAGVLIVKKLPAGVGYKGGEERTKVRD